MIRTDTQGLAFAADIRAALSRSLGFRTVAEGVELCEQEVLGRHGFEFIQAYYFCRPIPAGECQTLLFDLAERSSFTDILRIP
jgi:EAL domain-containing protein (putative c-di-GMP-specific phosphodiesterase class I)